MRGIELAWIAVFGVAIVIAALLPRHPEPVVLIGQSTTYHDDVKILPDVKGDGIVLRSQPKSNDEIGAVGVTPHAAVGLRAADEAGK